MNDTFLYVANSYKTALIQAFLFILLQVKGHKQKWNMLCDKKSGPYQFI